MNIQTPRLWMVATPVAVMRQRLIEEDFFATLLLDDQHIQVHFPPEWPGDALGFFPNSIKNLEANPDAPQWGGFIVERKSLEVVGGMGFKGGPNEQGEIEMGYGINPAWHNKGIATEMAAALVQWAFMRNDVTKILAETNVDNIASQRVLEKNNFVQVGKRTDPEDGELIVWALEKPKF